eukprot:TRINITY_DN37412_c0_g2_i1.p1 TRINITY_DN37412_c0_g2~~TRINITY_DN37412_c0_g2_i1.p1  ORF type:complete len:635 (-),score=32.04 TRINITY_DN37412_c0_g2_i1:548-2386(-)
MYASEADSNLSSDSGVQPDGDSGPVIRRRVSLVSDLSGELLRGVPLDRALEGYGKHWAGNSGGQDRDFLLSEVSDHIGDFISHDWLTPRAVKYVTLSYIYNSKPALILSTCFAAVVVLVKEIVRQCGHHSVKDEGQPHAFNMGLCSFVGPLVYLLLLFHWQSIRARLGRRTLLFVDKLCIAQHDEDMKRKGILGLAGFLRHSSRMVVLWSPRYFSRLWCTYELAAWFRLERTLSNVVFVPVGIPPIIVAAFLCNAFASLCFYVDAFIAGGRKLFFYSMLFLTWVLVAFFFELHFVNVRDLRHQLDSFSIELSSCFCCSNGHTSPVTGARIPCDREMVYETLREWMLRRCSDGDGHIDHIDAHLLAFDNKVRLSLKEYVTNILPERRLFIRYADMVHISFATVWLSIDLAVRDINEGYALVVVLLSTLEALAVCFFTTPLALTFLLKMMRVADHYTGCVRGDFLLLSALGLWGPMGFVSFFVLYQTIYSGSYVYRLLDMQWLQFVAMAVQALTTYCIFGWRVRVDAQQQPSWSLRSSLPSWSVRSDGETSRSASTCDSMDNILSAEVVGAPERQRARSQEGYEAAGALSSGNDLRLEVCADADTEDAMPVCSI